MKRIRFAVLAAAASIALAGPAFADTEPTLADALHATPIGASAVASTPLVAQLDDGLLAPDGEAAPPAEAASASPAADETAPGEELTPGDAGGFLRDAYRSAKQGNWGVLAGNVLLIIAIVAGLRKWLRRAHGWFGTPRGGAILAMGVAVSTHLGHAMVVGGFAAVSFDVLMTAIALGVAAMGTFTGTKKVTSST